MIVRDAMVTQVLTLGPDHSLRDAARLMHESKVGSVVVVDPDVGVGVLSERTVVSAIASDLDPDSEHARDHLAMDAVYATPTMTLEEATEKMRRGGGAHDEAREWSNSGDSCGVALRICRGPRSRSRFERFLAYALHASDARVSRRRWPS